MRWSPCDLVEFGGVVVGQGETGSGNVLVQVYHGGRAGISKIFGERYRSHASATNIGVASSRPATAESTPD